MLCAIRFAVHLLFVGWILPAGVIAQHCRSSLPPSASLYLAPASCTYAKKCLEGLCECLLRSGVPVQHNSQMYCVALLPPNSREEPMLNCTMEMLCVRSALQCLHHHAVAITASKKPSAECLTWASSIHTQLTAIGEGAVYNASQLAHSCRDLTCDLLGHQEAPRFECLHDLRNPVLGVWPSDLCTSPTMNRIPARVILSGPLWPSLMLDAVKRKRVSDAIALDLALLLYGHEVSIDKLGMGSLIVDFSIHTIDSSMIQNAFVEGRKGLLWLSFTKKIYEKLGGDSSGVSVEQIGRRMVPGSAGPHDPKCNPACFWLLSVAAAGIVLIAMIIVCQICKRCFPSKSWRHQPASSIAVPSGVPRPGYTTSTSNGQLKMLPYSPQRSWRSSNVVPVHVDLDVNE